MDETRALLLQPGLTGTVTVEGEDTEFAVTIDSATAADDATGSGSEATAPLTTFSPSAPIAPELLGRTATIEVVLAASDGHVLAVPTGAVRADGDGEYLMLVGDDGETRRVGFAPGIAIGGWVEITDPDEALEAGGIVRAG